MSPEARDYLARARKPWPPACLSRQDARSCVTSVGRKISCQSSGTQQQGRDRGPRRIKFRPSCNLALATPFPSPPNQPTPTDTPATSASMADVGPRVEKADSTSDVDEKIERHTTDGELTHGEKDVNETGEEVELHRSLSPAQISMIAIG